ncbi:MAG TPA: ABC-F family ATP-binding cassette domain-containing protein, partial [Candidatus Atribacteria bacterium]|nr:ABC-F family ATP-binding cassette domain-containing protein [Candidatus Atribacteria bacterium]
MALLFQCIDIKKDFGLQSVLKQVSFDIEEGERVGLVGENGAGKTTLADIIYGSVKPDEGSIIWHKKDVRIGYLRQSAYYTSETLGGLLRDWGVKKLLNTLTDTADGLVSELAGSWGNERLDALSGGEKTKLALARVWADEPDLLILDEPTNHLDYKGVRWLIEELARFAGTILIISHDRYFLDRTAHCILEIEDGRILEYRGNYSFYRAEKRKRYEDMLHAYKVQERYKEKLAQEIRQLREWAGKAHRDSTKKDRSSGVKMGFKEYHRVKAKKLDKRVKSKIKRLEKLKAEGIDKPVEEAGVKFTFEYGEKKGRRIIEAVNISKSFGSRALFSDSSFYILRGERVGIFGENGCGKTTLVKALIGQETVEGGLFVSPNAEIGYMSQDVLDFSNSGQTALDLFDMGDRREQGRIRTMLANLGFTADLLSKPVCDLSLGEQTRLKLAGFIYRQCDVLILDEPTNHLDIHAREQLEDALLQYDGTILLV